MQRRGMGGIVLGLVVGLAVSGALLLVSAGRAMPLCSLGQITKVADPSLSAPSPTYPGSTITSSGGSWTTCNQAFTGFYKEWLRDGVVISGPTLVSSSPGSFTYVVQQADVGHSIRSAVRPCNADGCFNGYAQSSNTVAPSPTPPPAELPPSPMQLYFDEGFTYSVTDEAGNVVLKQSMENLPAGWSEISSNGGEAGVYAPGSAPKLEDAIIGSGGGFAIGVAGRRCYYVDKHKTAHDAITRVVVWRFHQTVHWCARYPSIEEGSLAVDSFFSDVDPLFEVNWDDRGGGFWYTWRGSLTGGHYSRRQGRIDNCFFKYGCIGSHYSQIEIWINGNGAFLVK